MAKKYNQVYSDEEVNNIEKEMVVCLSHTREILSDIILAHRFRKIRKEKTIGL